LLESLSFPDQAEWQPLLQRVKVAPDIALSAAVRARVNGTDFQTELLASGFVTEEAFFKALAEETGLTFVSRIDPDRLMLREADCLTLLQSRNDHKPVRVEGDDGIFHVIAPERLSLGAFRALITRCPGLHARLRLTTPAALRKALLARAEPLLVRAAARGLFDKYPQYSARIVASAWQGMVWGAVMAGLATTILFIPDAAFGFVHFIFSICYLACIALRFAALPTTQPPAMTETGPATASEMPVYSVLIALYDEAEMVPGLLDSLQRLSWPRSKLEIKLVCEADDRATLTAIRARPLLPHIEVIETPLYGPRTKPKALAYALPIARGEIVALFDAEDHPHPLQLIQAWQRFRDSDESLACVQAPLEIANRSGSLISRMFFFEYAALFRGLLPWLARKGLVLPLGGTSNHFRRAALEKVGGWDPHNVTEDADLGLRLARFGYRSETISCPTMEDAPEDFGTWLPQRTRWFKGWVQTWLVHMRSPSRLVGEVGFGSFVIAQILFAGLIISALTHPLMAAMVLDMLLDIKAGRPLDAWESSLLPLDIFNASCGYLSFLLLGWRTLRPSERKGFWKVVLFIPVYWLMISLAAWRSVWQLWQRPHHWEKTAHRRAVQANPQALRISS
jgi:cellulose synthase/poly-beta-1,6-N-acetylglucosamine synthase-like glycosyltransferase